jgi:hypothetical protein
MRVPNKAALLRGDAQKRRLSGNLSGYISGKSLINAPGNGRKHSYSSQARQLMRLACIKCETGWVGSASLSFPVRPSPH